ncbi:MAG: ArsR family transcriptional regulator [Alphaproteobacteria bacterium]|nr:MAG: ArsR family transcriptional regulator [Alphaproteobacteria bacterium]
MEKTNVITCLNALAQESRLDVFRYLVTRGQKGAPAGEIAARCNLPKTTLSFHLKELKIAGLVKCERRGRMLIYSANYDAMADLMGYLTENCCAEGDACLAVSPACST